MNVQRVIAHNVRKYRVKKALSQEALAFDADIDRSYVGRLERGMENPTVGLLDRLAGALEVDLRRLFDPPGPGERFPKPLPSGRKRK